MKKILPLLVLNFVSYYAIGQFPIPVTQRISTPYGTVNHTYYVPGAPMNHYYNLTPDISKMYPFTVVMKNDSVFSTTAQIDIAEKPHTLYFREKRKKYNIKPDETKQIFRINENGKRINGIPTDSCWLFKSITGKINAYSFVAELNSKLLTAIQKGNEGEIVPVTEESLTAMMATSDKKLLALIKKKKFQKAINSYNKL